MSDEPQPGKRLTDAEFELVTRLTPLVSIDLIVRCPAGKVLVGRRQDKPAQGKLFVPGGRITKNETRAQAFRRITKSELGIEKGLKDARLLGIYDHIYKENRFDKDGFGTHYVVLAYEVTIADGIDLSSDEHHTEKLWLDRDELLKRGDVHERTRDYHPVIT